MKPTTIATAVPFRAAPHTAQEVFDAITAASYRGMAFREVLRNDPEAMRAAIILADAMEAAGVAAH